MNHGCLNAESLAAAAKTLAGNDPALAQVLARHGFPPLWKRPATFATLVRIILEQQVSLASAKATFGKLALACDGKINAVNMQQLGDEGLRASGFSRQKARYALALADDVLQKRFRVGALRHRDDGEVRELITAAGPG